jgi:hypothetical protein
VRTKRRECVERQMRVRTKREDSKKIEETEWAERDKTVRRKRERAERDKTVRRKREGSERKETR